jgi:FkbM family methyltransferase
MYSQNNEEQIITKALEGITGSFLDIGAFDGKALSNTYRLVELGWSGVCVEPSPCVFVRLAELHKDNPKISLVNAAITPGTAGTLCPWYDSNGDGVSSVSAAHKDKWEAGSTIRFNKHWVYTMPLGVLFESFGTQHEFINIDVESINIDLFRALPWTQLTATRVICVEHDGHVNEMRQIAEQYGFRPIGQNAENVIMSR